MIGHTSSGYGGLARTKRRSTGNAREPLIISEINSDVISDWRKIMSLWSCENLASDGPQEETDQGYPRKDLNYQLNWHTERHLDLVEERLQPSRPRCFQWRTHLYHW